MREEELIKEIIVEIKKFDTIICLRHINPDGDAFGSQLGLKKLINLNFKNKKVYCLGTQPERFKVLGKMDVISDETFKDALVIITDTGSIQRIEDNRYRLAKEVIKIDHHPDVNQFGDLQWTDASYTSASEMIGQLAKVGGLKLDVDTEKTIMFGIMSDSNRFGIENVTSKTFEVASYLMKEWWNIQEVYQMLSPMKVSYLEAQKEVLDNMVVRDGVGATFLTKEMMLRYHVPYDRNDMFTNLLENVDEVQVRVSFSANENGTYRVEFRSNQVKINQIAEKYGGGGHKLVCGATIQSLDIAPKIIDDLIATLKSNQ